MGSVPVDDLIKAFQRMYHERWAYQWGVARQGVVDCSGAFVWAYKQFGATIAHGSNTIARTCVTELLPITACRPGMAVFKYREPGEQGYDLPVKYRKGGKAYNGDLRDYYHIGLADSDAAYVLNAQSTATGFVRSPLKRGGWDACGYLKAVDYKTGGTPMIPMIVTAENGGKVKIRCTPSTTGRWNTQLRVGTVVQAGEDIDGWRAVKYKDTQGYMLSEFLAPYTPPEDVATSTDLSPVAPPAEPVTISLTLPKDAAQALLDALVNVLGVG